MEILLAGLAQLLLKKWKSSPELKGTRKNLLLDLIDLQSGLKDIAVYYDDFRNLLKTAGDAEDIDLETVEGFIKRFQKINDVLFKDGVLGQKTFKILKDTKGCSGEPEGDQKALSDAAKAKLAEKGNETWYFYYVDNLPHVPGPPDIPNNYSHVLLDVAWAAWMECANVNAERLRDGEQELANVIVTTAMLPSNVLGKAHVGPPGNSVLELQMDDRPNWNEDLFFNAICHEIGHLLGLTHSGNPADLMYPQIPQGVNGPTSRDCARAVGLLGAAD